MGLPEILIVLGIAPVIIRDMQGRVQDLPREQLIKAQSLGASSWQIALRVVLPQVLPRLSDSVRLSLGAAWIFLGCVVLAGPALGTLLGAGLGARAARGAP